MGTAFLGLQIIKNSPKYIIYGIELYILKSSLVFVITPSTRLKIILDKYNLKPVRILEAEADNNGNIEESISKTLNKTRGIYACVNIINGNIYVGSAGINRMYKRYRAHLYGTKGGSTLVNKRVLKYGLENFRFVLLENTADIKEEILLREQHYIDRLLPQYNILKLAGSLKGYKWTIEQRERASINVSDRQKERIRNLNLGKIISEDTRQLLSLKATGRELSEETRKLISENNRRSQSIRLIDNGNHYITFKSITECAKHFEVPRDKIKYVIKKGIKFFDKYTIKKL